MTASNLEIGTDGGLHIEFKTDSFIYATKSNVWLLTEYWGRYTRQQIQCG